MLGEAPKFLGEMVSDLGETVPNMGKCAKMSHLATPLLAQTANFQVLTPQP